MCYLTLDEVLKLYRRIQGGARFNIYTGTVELDGQVFNVPVLGEDTILNSSLV